MTPFNFISTALAVFFVSYIVVNTKGPLNIFARLHKRFPPLENGGIGDAITCMWCLATYAAGVFVVLWIVWPHVAVWVSTWFGMAGGALVLHSWSGWRFDGD